MDENCAVIDRDPATNEDVRIDCRALGSGSYTVPSLVEGLRFETDAKFILGRIIKDIEVITVNL